MCIFIGPEHMRSFAEDEKTIANFKKAALSKEIAAKC